MEGIELDCIMVHVLEAGLTFLEANNPKNRPSVKGFNIINGQLADSSDGATFESRNPALLSDVLGAFPLSTRQMLMQHWTPPMLHSLHGLPRQHQLVDKSLETWADC